jgi:hypothetical protein
LSPDTLGNLAYLKAGRGLLFYFLSNRENILKKIASYIDWGDIKPDPAPTQMRIHLEHYKMKLVIYYLSIEYYKIKFLLKKYNPLFK